MKANLRLVDVAMGNVARELFEHIEPYVDNAKKAGYRVPRKIKIQHIPLPDDRLGDCWMNRIRVCSTKDHDKKYTALHEFIHVVQFYNTDKFGVLRTNEEWHGWSFTKIGEELQMPKRVYTEEYVSELEAFIYAFFIMALFVVFAI